MIYNTIFNKLNALGFLNVWDHATLKVEGFMPLEIEVLRKTAPLSSNPWKIISVMHWYLQEGDVMRDPDMEIRVYTNAKIAEALSYRQDGVPGVGTIFQEVYPEPGKINQKHKKELNVFLNQWLTNIKDQGFKYPESEVKKNDSD